MQKIKITSTTKIKNLEALNNIDISYGVSYITKDLVLKNLDTYNSLSIQVLNKLDNFIPVFNKDKIEDTEIIKYMIKDIEYLASINPDLINDLHIQINNKSLLTKTVKFLSIFNKKNKLNIQQGIDSNIAFFNPFHKKIFIGLNMFKKGHEQSDFLSKNFKHEDFVSYVFFHEYSHGLEYANYSRYKGKATNNDFDKLYKSLRLLNLERIDVIDKLITGKEYLSVPEQNFTHMLRVLHQEMYADVNALLLMRNKALSKGDFNSENFQNNIELLSEDRKKDNRKSIKLFEKMSYNMLNFNDHFTSPALDCLNYHLDKHINNHDKILNEEQMHDIVTKCVQEGVAKTLLAMTQAMPKLTKQLNTLLTINITGEHILLDKESNHYQHAIDKIYAKVPETWKNKFAGNVQILNTSMPVTIMNAALDYVAFEERIAQITKEKISMIRDNQTEKNQQKSKHYAKN